MQATSDTSPATISPEGELLDALHKRIVRWHYAIAESASQVAPEVQTAMMREMMDTLREIAAAPAFRAAREARPKPRVRRPSEARIARIRAKAASASE